VSVERALAVKAGLGGRWPHAKPDDPGGAPWKDLCAEISRHDNRTLLILGANGVETFGRQGSPLYEVMQTFLGQTRVILIDPNSTQAAGRAAALSQNTGEYKRAIGVSTKRLRDLRHQQHSIEVRSYDGLPNWKMIITSRTAWIHITFRDNTSRKPQHGDLIQRRREAVFITYSRWNLSEFGVAASITKWL
jgi:hypothetical protein